ncbi:hypothetical protein CEXT_434021 [Caerostris extrusa]|uniref:Uncharacterized protein n=1 Tax=Caerostris extrusa TaxID=172846 RepID=A0AAV4XUN7_CAEEX|nr:hypothetical protein CEXT_434021 [Caerostris extrusa]
MRHKSRSVPPPKPQGRYKGKITTSSNPFNGTRHSRDPPEIVTSNLRLCQYENVLFSPIRVRAFFASGRSSQPGGDSLQLFCQLYHTRILNDVGQQISKSTTKHARLHSYSFYKDF